MSANKEPAGPLGGWFGTFGGFAGLGLALSVGGGMEMEAMPLMVFCFVAMVVGGWIGLFMEHIVARLIIILILVLEFAARGVIWSTIKGVLFGDP